MIRLAAAILAFLYLGCERAAPMKPVWMIARREITASDDASQRLRRGFGVQAVERRGTQLRTSEGHWFEAEAFELATPATSAPASSESPSPRPSEIALGERWIDVDLAAQRLVAYEGDRAVRAMKISTGVGEEGAPYSTPKGLHRIYAKLRQATMASEPSDPHPYRFEAVPDVQYFDREIALHGAYWHHRFGERVSHGCVNLAPADAAWLFDFTSPHLVASERERATAPGKPGTLVRVR